MNRAQKNLLGLAFLALQFNAPLASAHPGHSLDAFGAGHVITSPYHLGLLVLTAVLLGTASWIVKRRMPRRVLQICGVVALLAAGALWIVSITNS